MPGEFVISRPQGHRIFCRHCNIMKLAFLSYYPERRPCLSEHGESFPSAISLTFGFGDAGTPCTEMALSIPWLILEFSLDSWTSANRLCGARLGAIAVGQALRHRVGDRTRGRGCLRLYRRIGHKYIIHKIENVLAWSYWAEGWCA